MIKKKVLLIGWDAADWNIIHPLMDKGLMPSLNKLVNAGVMGAIRTLEPPLSPMLWTSIATGKTADKHGILGFLETNEDNGKVEPVSNLSRKSRAIWNILNSKGYRSNVLNWWPSHPAEPINGVMVSNFFNQVTAPSEEEWKINKMGVHPEKWVDELASLRVHGEEITPELVQPFIPILFEIFDQLDDRDHKLINKVRKFLAECISVHAQATLAMEKEDWDFTAIYYETIDKFSHSFMHFAPPKMKRISEKDYERYRFVINAIYVFHDMMLDRLLQLAGHDTTVILLSDHGFHSGDLRPKSLPKYHASIALQHNPVGIFVMKGPGIRSDQNIMGMGLLDLVPTLLTHLDLPVGKDMDGKVIQQCFENPREVKYIDSWEEESGDFGEHKQRPPAFSESSDLVLQELSALGYITLDADKDVQWNKTKLDQMYHLSVVHASRGRLDEATRILEELYEQDKVDVRINIDLIDLYCRSRECTKAREVLTMFRKINIEKLVNFDMLEVKILMAERKAKKALEVLKTLYKQQKNQIPVRLEMASAYRSMNEIEAALKMYEEVVDLDPQNYRAFHGLGICQIQLGQFENGAQSCLAAIAIHFDAPGCHYHLGEALIGLDLLKDAANALETSLALNPRTHRARKRLIELYRGELHNEDMAMLHEAYFQEQDSNEIIVVSGLPRSGTSLMMQMLEAGGVPIFTDGIRKKDENNPKGYYESEAVKTIRRNNKWLKDARGKAIKIIAPFLSELKLNYRYKVIFMERDMNEILLSQQRMKQRLNPDLTEQPPHYNVKLAEGYAKELETMNQWLEEQPNIAVIRVAYSDLLEKGEGEIQRLDDFLDQSLDHEAMKKKIDPTLYRERVSTNSLK